MVMVRYPRNCLLNFTSEFLAKCSTKMNEINKKSAQEKSLELLDQKCFIRLNEVGTTTSLTNNIKPREQTNSCHC